MSAQTYWQPWTRQWQTNVNILLLSLGGGRSNYYQDNVVVGAFGAMEKGILASYSTGNSDSSPYSLPNVAPWIPTVSVGILDHDFLAFVSFGNG